MAARQLWRGRGDAGTVHIAISNRDMIECGGSRARLSRRDTAFAVLPVVTNAP